MRSIKRSQQYELTNSIKASENQIENAHLQKERKNRATKLYSWEKRGISGEYSKTRENEGNQAKVWCTSHLVHQTKIRTC